MSLPRPHLLWQPYPRPMAAALLWVCPAFQGSGPTSSAWHLRPQLWLLWSLLPRDPQALYLCCLL